MSNVLYCGDNLEVLYEYVPDASVDLIYLDPPFNSQRTYNVVYKGSRAQETAFKDYWSWQEAAGTYATLVVNNEAPLRVRTILKSLHDHLIDDDSDLLAYLTMMAPRLVALHRVLKETGSMYLHCDPTASHYLKVLLDAIFRAGRFRTEIVWKRSGAHSDAKQGRQLHGHIHDVILFYTKSEHWTWNDLYTPYDDSYVERDYRLVDESGRRFRRGDLTAAKPGGDVEYTWHVKRHRGVRERWIADLDDEHKAQLDDWEYKGVRPYKGRYWAYSRENMRQYAREGRLRHTFDGMPEYKRFLDEMPGVTLQDIWTDIILGAKERVGYPTQKPLALLERIIASSSRPDDVVLDPFCGCGTAVVASQKLGRRWIGIDIARTAVEVLETRFRDNELPDPSIVWHPVDAEAASALADRDKDQFEVWVRRKLRAEKRRRDRGIDGECFYKDDGGKSWHVIISVKGGKTLNPAMVRELRGTIEREHAAVGILVVTHEASKEMRLEATRALFLPVADAFGPIPRLQIVTVEQMFQQKRPIRVPGENHYRPTPSIPQKGQTAMMFSTTLAKVRPAQEARTKAKLDAKAREPEPMKSEEVAPVPVEPHAAVDRAASGGSRRASSRPPRKLPSSRR
jgi:DNA modification methylase